jgi:hypothetical protein
VKRARSRGKRGERRLRRIEGRGVPKGIELGTYEAVDGFLRV